MQTNFTDAAEACAEIAACIRRDFPADTLEITYHVRGQQHARRHVGNGRDLEGVLQGYTAGFPGLRALYTPHHPYGLVCMMECWCQHHELSGEHEPCTCEKLHNRSCIAIIVQARDNQPIRIGNHAPPTRTGHHANPPRPWRAEDQQRH